nr:MAG TPA: hypothetical protein [Bacteriophage sp.]
MKQTIVFPIVCKLAIVFKTDDLILTSGFDPGDSVKRIKEHVGIELDTIEYSVLHEIAGVSFRDRFIGQLKQPLPLVVIFHIPIAIFRGDVIEIDQMLFQFNNTFHQRTVDNVGRRLFNNRLRHIAVCMNHFAAVVLENFLEFVLNADNIVHPVVIEQFLCGLSIDFGFHGGPSLLVRFALIFSFDHFGFHQSHTVLPPNVNNGFDPVSGLTILYDTNFLNILVNLCARLRKIGQNSFFRMFQII